MALDPYKNKESEDKETIITEEEIIEIDETTSDSSNKSVTELRSTVLITKKIVRTDPEDYAQFVNPYYTTENMQSWALLFSNAGISPAGIIWGFYQPLIIPATSWPSAYINPWNQSVFNARINLNSQGNSQYTFPDLPEVGLAASVQPYYNCPSTKVGLLDAVTQICFSVPSGVGQPPGIAMTISVETSVSSNNDIAIAWDFDGDGYPTMLYLTMYCPPAS